LSEARRQAEEFALQIWMQICMLHLSCVKFIEDLREEANIAGEIFDDSTLNIRN